jgi:hypothetical protein
MKLNQAKIRKAKSQLRRLHKVVKSYRIIARDYYGGEIKFGTLQRFTEDKNYIPKDGKLLNVLGLITPPNPYRNLPRWYKRIPEALAFFNRKREQIREMSRETKRQTKNQ